AADPRIGTDLVADLAAEHLPGRQAESAAFQVPQRLFETGERRHHHRPATVEAAAIANLPDVLDVERIGADEPIAERLEGPVDRFGPAFETRFAPADRAVFAFDPNEQPAGRRVERLDAADFPAHASAFLAWLSRPPKWRPAASSSPSSTLRILRSRSNRPSGLTLPFCSRSAVSQSI